MKRESLGEPSAHYRQVSAKFSRVTTAASKLVRAASLKAISYFPSTSPSYTRFAVFALEYTLLQRLQASVIPTNMVSLPPSSLYCQLTKLSHQSLRITPLPPNPSHTTAELGAPSVPGVHDTLRHNLGLTSSNASATSQQSVVASGHPLEARLANWRATHDALKMEGLRRVHGLGEPIRRGMELKIAREGEWMPRVLGGGARVHEDVLAGRDCEVGWEDVFKGKLKSPW